MSIYSEILRISTHLDSTSALQEHLTPDACYGPNSEDFGGTWEYSPRFVVRKLSVVAVDSGSRGRIAGLAEHCRTGARGLFAKAEFSPTRWGGPVRAKVCQLS